VGEWLNPCMAKDRKRVRTDTRPGETEEQRLDRNYNELLQEMRVLQAGMQILFAFLLTLAFQQRFVEIDDFERNVYLGTLVSAALATACNIGPVPFHRLVFRRGMKDDLIRATARYVGAGLALLFLCITGAMLLVLDFLFSRPLALGITAALAVTFLVLWVLLPLLARLDEVDDEQDRP
jgi:VIT1/CCC1 family predicted Fe2+/Mn2+ transporter